ncbi:DUF1365 domain-containing protein [Capillimicrobium parvum]|uniref:DUF1365 domain-containing protein n=1 Tax=Capillimicrobium parvum TaxID=2884022 RepID=A0A9E6XWT9_9ACTN|nr:DUF1365 domain-containing protein [Capillimicrobium parvum]UGS35883.1 hypothetical protein DSM104329_02280 [Capillimicrobium parvum]
MTALHSAIYDGTIAHRRRVGRGHGFRHRITLAYVDLEEVAGLRGGRLAARRPGLLRFRREDYLGDPAVPLDAAVRALVRERIGRAPDGPIRLLTHLRAAGRCFNPVSFYYCFAADGGLAAVVAEVTNTPWGERHAYVLEGRTGRSDKALHVSPFFGMDQEYAWSSDEPAERLTIRIANHEGDRRVFDAALSLRRRPPSRRAWRRHTASALRVGVLIYIHALVLKVKGAPLHPHPTPAP